jgi:hypothetical protein
MLEHIGLPASVGVLKLAKELEVQSARMGPEFTPFRCSDIQLDSDSSDGEDGEERNDNGDRIDDNGRVIVKEGQPRYDQVKTMKFAWLDSDTMEMINRYTRTLEDTGQVVKKEAVQGGGGGGGGGDDDDDDDDDDHVDLEFDDYAAEVQMGLIYQELESVANEFQKAHDLSKRSSSSSSALLLSFSTSFSRLIGITVASLRVNHWFLREYNENEFLEAGAVRIVAALFEGCWTQAFTFTDEMLGIKDPYTRDALDALQNTLQQGVIFCIGEEEDDDDDDDDDDNDDEDDDDEDDGDEEGKGEGIVVKDDEVEVDQEAGIELIGRINLEEATTTTTEMDGDEAQAQEEVGGDDAIIEFDGFVSTSSEDEEGEEN